MVTNDPTTINADDYLNAQKSTGGSYTFSTSACIHKLPCGYCTILNRVCPMSWSQPYIYTTTTCGTGLQNVGSETPSNPTTATDFGKVENVYINRNMPWVWL